MESVSSVYCSIEIITSSDETDQGNFVANFLAYDVIGMLATLGKAIISMLICVR